MDKTGQPTPVAPVQAAQPTPTPIQTAVPAYPSQPQPAAVSDNVYQDVPPPSDSRYAVMSTWGYVGTTILLSIPVIGWLICLVWACGGTSKVNKRNYSRAILIFVLTGILISAALYFFVRWMTGMAIATINESAGGAAGMGGVEGIKQLLEMLLQYINSIGTAAVR
jgi:hypothetical protein